ncbi:MAG: hypothetical protein ACRCVT_04545 [Leadbetterella sp.]
MRKFTLTLVIVYGVFDFLMAQQKIEIYGQKYTAVDRTILALEENDKKGIRFNEGKSGGVAWLDDVSFTEGIIEFDVRGRDEFQKSFVGIAFHGTDDKTYEGVYFRPFNFNLADKARNAHAIQYIFEPFYPWHVLRKLRYDEFEAPIGIPNISKTDWFHAKIEVRNGRIKVYVNSSEKPLFDIASLNTEGKKGNKIGFWVGDNSNGDFANLRLGE